MGWVLQGLAQWPQVCLLVDRVPDRKQQLNAKNCLLNTACPTAAVSRIHLSANAMTCWLWIFFFFFRGTHCNSRHHVRPCQGLSCLDIDSLWNWHTPHTWVSFIRTNNSNMSKKKRGFPRRKLIMHACMQPCPSTDTHTYTLGLSICVILASSLSYYMSYVKCAHTHTHTHTHLLICSRRNYAVLSFVSLSETKNTALNFRQPQALYAIQYCRGKIDISSSWNGFPLWSWTWST